MAERGEAEVLQGKPVGSKLLARDVVSTGTLQRVWKELDRMSWTEWTV